MAWASRVVIPLSLMHACKPLEGVPLKSVCECRMHGGGDRDSLLRLHDTNMLATLWFSLLVSSLRCLTSGVSLFEMLITSVILSFVADAVIGALFGTPGHC